MAKKIAYSTQAINKLLKGLNKLADAVKCTLGPGGNNVMIGQSFGSPKITKDGVTVAKEVELSDPIENAGAQIIKEAATQTNEFAGDGTTTATLLAQYIANEGAKYLLAGVNTIVMKKGIDKAVERAVEYLKKMAKKVEGKDDLIRVATISANNDEEIGKLIAEVIHTVGREGVVTVEEGKSFKTEVEYVEGMQFDRGYISPYFITDPERLEAVLEGDVLIFVTDKKLSTVQDVTKILELAVQEGKPLLIIADDVESHALATLVLNKLRGVVKVAAVKAPAFGERKKEILKDISILTGASYISEETGRSLDAITVEDFGHARKVIVGKENTVIVDGKGDPKAIEARIAEIKKAIELTDSDYDREKLEERLAKLTGGVAVIRVGAASETELKEIKYRIEDALNATRAALEEGVVPGGGVAYYKAREAVEKLLEEEKLEEAEKIGAKIILEALRQPLRQIAINAGKEPGIVEATLIREGKGYDARHDRFVDMMEAGIIDPLKVVRLAITYAASVAGMLLTTKAVIVEKEEKKKDEPAEPDVEM